MTVREIVKAHLVQNGFDGLYDDIYECGCGVDDLMPCDGMCANCEVGYKLKNEDGEIIYGPKQEQS